MTVEMRFRAVKPMRGRPTIWDVAVVRSLIVWVVLAPVFALFVHECAHAWVAARNTGRRQTVHVGRGRRLFGFRLGLLDIELRPLAIRDSCQVDLSGLPRDVARRVLRAGPMADFAQVLLCLMLTAAFPASKWTWLGLAMQYTWWGVTSVVSRHGLRFGEPYESDGYKLKMLESRVDRGVVAASSTVDPLVAFIQQEAPQLLGGEAPAPASAPAPAAVQVLAPLAAADPLLAYIQETAPELVAKVTDQRPVAPAAPVPAPPVPPAPPSHAATSIPPPGYR
jgi:hypothetical protein